MRWASISLLALQLYKSSCSNIKLSNLESASSNNRSSYQFSYTVQVFWYLKVLATHGKKIWKKKLSCNRDIIGFRLNWAPANRHTKRDLTWLRVDESDSREAIFLCFANICAHIWPFSLFIFSVSSFSCFVSDFAAKKYWETVHTIKTTTIKNWFIKKKKNCIHNSINGLNLHK